jgi:inhibitor of KinA
MVVNAASDRSLLVTFGDAISLDVHHRVAALTHSLQRQPLPGVRNIHPAYCSILIVYDPLTTTAAAIETALRERDFANAPVDGRVVEIPVCYGGEFGPDLDTLAALHQLDPQRVVELHTAPEYRVYFLGFTPGFAYLGGLAPELATPRLDTPRRHVAAGSVGIAGAQTGVYPFATPGGWRLIGRTPLTMFHPHREPMSLLAIGDRVRFTPISQERFREMESEP